jgi:hypothetical protein
LAASGVLSCWLGGCWLVVWFGCFVVVVVSILGKYSRSEVRVDRSVLQARVHAVMAIYANDC